MTSIKCWLLNMWHWEHQSPQVLCGSRGRVITCIERTRERTGILIWFIVHTNIVKPPGNSETINFIHCIRFSVSSTYLTSETLSFHVKYFNILWNKIGNYHLKQNPATCLTWISFLYLIGESVSLKEEEWNDQHIWQL